MEIYLIVSPPMFNDAPAKFSFIKYANYSVQTCNVMVAPEWKSNISGEVTIVWFSEV
jgi:hypothetical protein